MRTCQMTMEYDCTVGRSSHVNCDRPAKFKVPNPQMRVEYVCGIHARSLNRMFEKTNQNIRCMPLGQAK